MRNILPGNIFRFFNVSKCLPLCEHLTQDGNKLTFHTWLVITSTTTYTNLSFQAITNAKTVVYYEKKNWHRTCLRCLNFFVTLPWTWVTQQISLLFSRTPKRHRLFDLKNITPGRFCKEMLLNVRVWSRSLFEKLDFTRNYNICLKHHMSTRCRDSAHRSISLSMTLIWQYVILG